MVVWVRGTLCGVLPASLGLWFLWARVMKWQHSRYRTARTPTATCSATSWAWPVRWTASPWLQSARTHCTYPAPASARWSGKPAAKHGPCDGPLLYYKGEWGGTGTSIVQENISEHTKIFLELTSQELSSYNGFLPCSLPKRLRINKSL